MMRLIPVRVLVIDDEDSVCRKLAGWLTEAAYDVVTFTDPAAGVDHAGRIFSQLALVDLRWPDADGIEVIRHLLRVSPRTRILALAAFPEVAHVLAAIRAGARDVLEKPVQAPVLLAALERHLGEIGVSVRTEAEFNRRLGARLRAARLEAELTLADVARAAGLSAAQLSHIELGKTATSTWTLARICSSLNQPPAAIVSGL